MIYIKNVLTLDHEMIDYTVESPFEEVIDATGLTLFPALYDPHVCVDDRNIALGWKYLSRSALSGGATTILARPSPGKGSHQEIKTRMSSIQKQLKKSKIPIHVESFVSPDPNHLDTLPLSKSLVKGIYLSDASSFFSAENQALLDRLFRLSSEHNLPIAFKITKQALSKELNLVFNLIQKYSTKTYLYPVFKPSIINLVKQLKLLSFPIYSGTDLSFLFAHKLKKHPKLSLIFDNYTASDCDFLWDSINQGIVDCVGSSYHLTETNSDKSTPSFHLTSLGTMELSFPLMLSAHQSGLLTMDTLLKVLNENVRDIFNLNTSDDYVLIDMQKKMRVSKHLFRTIGSYQPFLHLQLNGWPVYTISQGRSFKLFTKK